MVAPSIGLEVSGAIAAGWGSVKVMLDDPKSRGQMMINTAGAIKSSVSKARDQRSDLQVVMGAHRSPRPIRVTST